MESMDRVLGLIEVANASRAVDESVAEWVEGKIAERTQARADRDFGRADEIRDELAEEGIVLEDGPDGTSWKVVG
jgi:cysteinyl-tRNA synthetase